MKSCSTHWLLRPGFHLGKENDEWSEANLYNVKMCVVHKTTVLSIYTQIYIYIYTDTCCDIYTYSEDCLWDLIRGEPIPA